ncbi:hypothetical protein PPYR_12696 [Photinus pyralis]|uniref:HMG box domain-containing protein n=1 Tax=Photinus pyralis TaxID=7054 RepID=A0A5N4A6X1_PHOPY|nr:transcription factor A, mitochondrial [Photinus pyralis]KAB0793076.1 hypothetical protein PPYR_12696 [Photinus pyralis]
MSIHALLSNTLLNCRGALINRVIAAFQPVLKLDAKVHKEAKPVEIPKGPKKPLSSYFQFLVETRPILLKQHPDWKQMQVVKQIALNWRNMDTTLKEKYEERYRKDHAVYEEEHTKYLSSLTAEQLDALEKLKADKRVRRNKRVIRKLWRDTGKPKRPLTNFGYFIKEKRELPENRGDTLGNVLNKYKEAWTKLPEEAKQKYTNMFKADQERYNAEIEKWEAKMVNEGQRKIVRKDSQIESSPKKPHHK